MSGFAWAEHLALRDLSHLPRMAGYYNDNFCVTQGNRDYLLRIPIPNSDVMDLRQICEVPILRYLEDQGFEAPRLVHQSPCETFSIHGWIEGQQLNELYPGETSLPDWIPLEIARQMALLHRLDPTPFAQSCPDLPASPDTQAFFLAHYAFDCAAHARLLPEMHPIYVALGVPEKPFDGLDKLQNTITARPFCLCHSDIHRKNIILREQENTLVLLDWELVLVGDPIYDIAVHFHKMRYEPDQEAQFIEVYVSNSALALEPATIRAEVNLYLRLERVKSAVIDAYRVRGDLRAGKHDHNRAWQDVTRYAGKLRKAQEIWYAPSAVTTMPTHSLHDILVS
ncbi:MAG: phosphotransferase family protein [Roseobacter sp.]